LRLAGEPLGELGLGGVVAGVGGGRVGQVDRGGGGHRGRRRGVGGGRRVGRRQGGRGRRGRPGGAGRARGGGGGGGAGGGGRRRRGVDRLQEHHRRVRLGRLLRRHLHEQLRVVAADLGGVARDRRLRLGDCGGVRGRRRRGSHRSRGSDRGGGGDRGRGRRCR